MKLERAKEERFKFMQQLFFVIYQLHYELVGLIATRYGGSLSFHLTRFPVGLHNKNFTMSLVRTNDL